LQRYSAEETIRAAEARQLIQRREAERYRRPLLSVREQEVLQLISDGHTNVTAGKKLFLSHETIKSHMAHIISKLDAKTRTHAVAIALRNEIIK
jgi:DNA-binding CsgD family transcriptional regulator